MELNYKSFGQGPPLLILHGLFGTLDNWQTLGKRWAENFTVFLVDQRNHGRSPHLPEHNYPVMAEDLKAFMEANWMYEAHIMGHSMGGKTAMQFALNYPDMVDKLIVVDIAPKPYVGGHEAIVEALNALPLAKIESRSQADAFLAERIADFGVRQFLLKKAPTDLTLLQASFPNAQLSTIDNAGHWVHAEQPTALFELVDAFLLEEVGL